MNFKDYYKILNIDQSSTLEEIKESFRRLAKQYHPDKNHSPNANDQFREIFEAYEILRDSTTRQAFDKIYNKYKEKQKPDFSREFVKASERKQNSAKTQADFYANMKYSEFINSVLFGTKFFVKRLPRLFIIFILIIVGIVSFIQFGILLSDYGFRGVYLMFLLLSISFIAIAVHDLNKILKEYNRQKVSAHNTR